MWSDLTPPPISLSDGGINVRFSGFFLEIPKNDVNVRFSGFPKIQGQGGKCAFFGIPKNAHNVRFSGFENFSFFLILKLHKTLPLYPK